MGWWGDAWDEVKSVAKKVQKNPHSIVFTLQIPIVPEDPVCTGSQ